MTAPVGAVGPRGLPARATTAYKAGRRGADVIDILVVDDQDLIRGGIAALLRAAPGTGTVTEAADGEAAVVAAELHRPDVVLMDIRMPGVSGLAAAESILALTPPPRVAVLTTFDEDEYLYAALRIGCSGFLLKDMPPARLLNALAVLADGDMIFAPTVTRRLIESYAPRNPARSLRWTALDQLTSREVEVLRLVATGMNNEEIAAALVVSEATVKTHLHHTMTKLDLRSRAQAVVVAYESGLVTPGRPQPGPEPAGPTTPHHGSAARTGAPLPPHSRPRAEAR